MSSEITPYPDFWGGPRQRGGTLRRSAMPDEPDAFSALEFKKLQQEVSKLEAETRLLNRPWWLQAPYVGAILPIMAVVITGWITYRNSDLRREAQAAKNEIAKLAPEADALRQQVTRLQKEKESLAPERDRLAQEVRVLEPKATNLQKRIRDYNAHTLTWRTQLLDISTRLKSKSFSGGGIQVFPPPNAEPERKLLQEVIDSMLSTLGPKSERPSSRKQPR
jgi:cell division protein FtsB